MARDIEQITPFTALEDSVVRNAGVEALPNSPSSAGIRASELKRRFYQPLEEVRDDIDDRFTKINSNFTEIDEDLTTLEGLAFDKANIEQEVSTSTTKVPSSNLLKTQLDLKVSKAGAENITGIKTYKSGATPLIEDAPSSNTMAANKAYVDTMIPLTAIKTAISGTPLDTNLLSEKFINTTYATKSDIASVFEYKGTVADYTALSAITGQGVGDTYNMTASYLNTPAGTNWAWNGTIWDALGGDIIIETAQSTSEVKVPSSKLLKESSFAATYRSLTDSRLLAKGITASSNPAEVVAAMEAGSILISDTNGYTNLTPTFTVGTTQGTIFIIKTSSFRSLIEWSWNPFNGVSEYTYRSWWRSDSGFSGWKREFTHDNISTVMPLSSAAASNEKVLGEKVVYDEFALKAPLANPTFTGTVIVPTTPSGPSAAVAKIYVDLKVALAGAETISGVKTFATGATPLITDAPTTSLMAVNKAYADGLTGLAMIYDKVIRNQTEFEALIGDPSETWLGAKSVALVGQFTLSTANNSGIKIPATVKQIHGFNGAKITITNFVYNATTAKAGLWYDTRRTTLDYSIRDLEVDCTGAYSLGFYNCTNLTNCTGTGTGTVTAAGGFYNCTNLTNCTGTGSGLSGYAFRDCTNLTNCTGTGTGTSGYGFYNCTNLTNCTGTGTGTVTAAGGFYNCTNLTNCTGTGAGLSGYGLGECTNLTNCTGTGTGADGYGFYSINYASNCRDGGGSDTMWGGTNRNIDIDTCCKTPVVANNTTLNT